MNELSKSVLMRESRRKRLTAMDTKRIQTSDQHERDFYIQEADRIEREATILEADASAG